MKNKKIQRSDVLLYIVFACVGNGIITNVISILLQWFIVPLNAGALIRHLLLFVGTFLATMGLFYLFYRERVHGYYTPNQNKGDLPKTVLALILPGEIVRFLLSLLSLGSAASTGAVSIIPTVLFEQTYLKWSNRYAIVRGGGSVIALDILMYVICYLIYFAAHFGALTAIFWYIWNVRKKGRKDLGMDDQK